MLSVLVSLTSLASWTMCSTDSSLEMLLVQRNASWNDAERSCQGAFGHLATVRGNSDCVMEAIKSLVTCSQDKFCGVANHAIHVGLRRSNIPTAYRWVGSLNKEEDVTTSRMFIPGNNISLRQDCTRLLALSPNAQVWTAGCSALGQYYLCQRRRPLGMYFLFVFLSVFDILYLKLCYMKKPTKDVYYKPANSFHSMTGCYVNRCREGMRKSVGVRRVAKFPRYEPIAYDVTIYKE